MTGDVKRIDDVLRRVDSLVTPFEELTFDHFDIRKMGSWKMMMQEFKTEVQVQNLSEQIRITILILYICNIFFFLLL